MIKSMGIFSCTKASIESRVGAWGWPSWFSPGVGGPGMEGIHGATAAYPRQNQFPPAAESGIHVGRDAADAYAQVGPGHLFVDFGRDAVLGHAQGLHLLGGGAGRVDNGVGGADFFAPAFAGAPGRSWGRWEPNAMTMTMSFAWNPCLVQACQYRRQQIGGGGWAGRCHPRSRPPVVPHGPGSPGGDSPLDGKGSPGGGLSGSARQAGGGGVTTSPSWVSGMMAKYFCVAMG